MHENLGRRGSIVLGVLWIGSLAIMWVPVYFATGRIILYHHYGIARVHSERLYIVGGTHPGLRISNGEVIGRGWFRVRSALFVALMALGAFNLTGLGMRFCRSWFPAILREPG